MLAVPALQAMGFVTLRQNIGAICTLSISGVAMRMTRGVLIGQTQQIVVKPLVSSD
jgi:hypothetical protein